MTNGLCWALAGLGTLAAAGLGTLAATPRLLSVTEPDLSAQFAGYGVRRTFVHISDYHYELLRVPERRIKDAFDRIDPDAVLFTGDLFCKAKYSLPALESLLRVTGGRPLYMCLGNHEYKAYRISEAPPGLPQSTDEFIGLAESRGCHICHDGVYAFQGVNIAVLDEFRANAGMESSYRQKAVETLNSCPADVPLILLCHNPSSAGVIARIPAGDVHRPDLVLCGHYHGGQIDLSGHPEYSHFRREMQYLPGHYRGLAFHDGLPVYISRGLGNVIVPFRFRSVPEITVLRLT